MPKVITMSDFLRMKREAEANAKEEAKRKEEKREKLYNGISYMGGLIIYWIACLLIVMGFYTVALMSL